MTHPFRALLLGALCAAFSFSAQAQPPAGTPGDGRGSVSSPSGNPAPQEEVETRRNADGEVETLDGRPVNTRDGNMTNDGDRDDSPKHSSPGGPTDEASDPGTRE